MPPTACDKDGDKADRALFELRPVVATNPPPCPAKPPKNEQLVLPLSADGKAAECLQLAQPIVDAKDVRSATVAETPAKEPALSVVLGGTGKRQPRPTVDCSPGKIDDTNLV